MQAMAQDSIIRHDINAVLKQGIFQGNGQVELIDMIALHRALLIRKRGKMQYISGKFLTGNR